MRDIAGVLAHGLALEFHGREAVDVDSVVVRADSERGVVRGDLDVRYALLGVLDKLLLHEVLIEHSDRAVLEPDDNELAV